MEESIQIRFLTKKKELQKLDEDNPTYKEKLSEFCEEFPFTYTYWNQYAQFVAMKEGKDEAMKIYERGLERNPYCFQLWKLYYFWAKDSYEDESVSGQILEQGLEKIGKDFESFFMWEDYLKREDNMKKKIEYFRRSLEIPLRNSEQLYLRFQEYINNKSNNEIVEYQQEINNNSSIQEMRESLIMEMERLYNLRSQQVKEKIKWEDKVVNLYSIIVICYIFYTLLFCQYIK